MTYSKKLFFSYIFYTLSAFGISLTIIANVGVSSYNSMNLAISEASDIRIGTVTIFLNSLFLVAFMVLTHFKHRSMYLIQALSVFMFGSLINFFTYDLLGGIPALTYLHRIMLISIGTTIGGLSIGMIVHFNVITFPLESLCLKVSEKTSLTFVKLRYGVDVVSILISLAISTLNHLPLYVREGTLISMLLLSASMNLSRDQMAQWAAQNN